GDVTVRTAIASTGRSILLAFVIGCAIGIVLGWILGLSLTLRTAFLAPVDTIMSTPTIILLPLFLPIFGIGPTVAAAFGAFEVIPYVAVNIVGGVLLVDQRHTRMAVAFKATNFQRFVTIVLPTSLPGLFTALWFGVKHAF